jgi:ribonuclease-3
MTFSPFHPFGYQFRDSALLTMALTHPRANNIKIARKATEDYQRLEFLGDRVVGLSVAGLLYRQFPLEPEGSLAKRHAHLVSRPVLANLAVAQAWSCDQNLWRLASKSSWENANMTPSFIPVRMAKD